MLLKLLWRGYLLVPSSISNGKMSPEENIKKSDIKHQTDHVQDFGKCITEILSGLFSVEPSLLSDFCSTFEKNCLDAFQQSENIDSRENLEKVIRFLLSVDLHAVRKGDTWPLSCLVGPMLSKSFQLMQTIVSWYPFIFVYYRHLLLIISVRSYFGHSVRAIVYMFYCVLLIFLVISGLVKWCQVYGGCCLNVWTPQVHSRSCAGTK